MTESGKLGQQGTEMMNGPVFQVCFSGLQPMVETGPGSFGSFGLVVVGVLERRFLHFVTLMSARGRASHDSEWKSVARFSRLVAIKMIRCCELAVDIIIHSTLGLVRFA